MKGLAQAHIARDPEVRRQNLNTGLSGFKSVSGLVTTFKPILCYLALTDRALLYNLQSTTEHP